MATKKQKEELIQYLKFTPVNYTVDIWGYGGECYAGTVDRKIYEYFKRHNIDLEEYASDWDNVNNVGEEYQPFEPGSPYECDNLGHACGATMDDSSYIQVSDENGNEVWRCSLSHSQLDSAGVELCGGDEIYLGNLDNGTIIIWSGQGEKGTFFSGEFLLTEPFDPAKLCVMSSDCDGWELCTSVSYNGDEIDNNGYNTTGKWGEHKWVVIGGEENLPEYQLSDQELVADLDHIVNSVQIMTDWYPVEILPVRKGEYEVILNTQTNHTPVRANWTGRVWKQNAITLEINQWRGLAHDPSLSLEDLSA